MKNLLKVIPIILFLLFTDATLWASQPSIEPYKAPKELKFSLDKIFADPVFKQAFMSKNKPKMASLGCIIYDTHWGNVVVEHPNLPGYLIKGEKPLQNRNWQRVFYGQEIKNAIGDNPSLIVATEYLYQYPDRPSTLHSNNYCVISEKIPFQGVSLATFLMDKPEMVKDIQAVMEKVGFWDPGINANIHVTMDDKIAFVDTEPYPNDHNFLIQPVLDLLFFRLQKRGNVTSKKLQLMIEEAKNSSLNKKYKTVKTIGKYALYSLAAYATIKIIQNRMAH